MAPVEKDHRRGLNGALAAEIRAEMGVQNISGHKLAERAGLDRLTLRRYTRGERALTTATVEAVAVALGLDAFELMRRAVERRDREPELYGPDTADNSGPAGKTDLSSFDHADLAARDEDNKGPKKGHH